jgi:hypothetical protein
MEIYFDVNRLANWSGNSSRVDGLVAANGELALIMVGHVAGGGPSWYFTSPVAPP